MTTFLPLPGARVVPAIGLVACLALAGCGTEEAGGGAVTADAVSLDDAKAVILDYLDKGFRGDAAACVHESAAFSAAEDEAMEVKDCTERIEIIKPMLTDGEPLLDLSGSTVTVREGEGGIAVVDLNHDDEGFYATYHLIVHEGRWVIESQPATLPPADDTASHHPDARQVPAAEAEALAAAVCALEVGTTRAEVEAILGEPTAEQVDDDGTDEVDWLINDDYYTVWFGSDGKVVQFSASSPRDGDPCAE